MRKMERLDIQKIESYWINHDENKNRLKYREQELLHSRHNADDLNANLRGNRISNPTEQKAAALTNDELYRNLNKIVQSIEQIYEQLDEDLKTIVNMRYWDKENNCYEWEDIADRLYMSRSKLLRKRNVIINLTAKKIGYV